MCGVLYVESRTARPLPQHLAAVGVLSSRGPDFVRYQHSDRVFIAQTVLHITGSTDLQPNKHRLLCLQRRNLQLSLAWTLCQRHRTSVSSSQRQLQQVSIF